MYDVEPALEGALPTQVGPLTAMSGYFGFDGNVLSGSVPTQIGRMTSLTRGLGLGGNAFSGTLPVSLAHLANLTGSLGLDANALSGTVPSSLALLTALTDGVYLGGNALSGTIPTQFGRLTRLQSHLTLDFNYVSGTLPSQLGRLGAMEVDLWLSDNSLSGTLPVQLGGLSSLGGVLALDDNRLSGSVPEAVCHVPAAAQGKCHLEGNRLTCPPCGAGSGGPAHCNYTAHEARGYLPKGGDVLPPTNKTPAEAAALCDGSAGCQAITFKEPAWRRHSSPRLPSPLPPSPSRLLLRAHPPFLFYAQGRVHVYFKGADALGDFTDDVGWRTQFKRMSSCGVRCHVDCV
jgi:hypothetical protein